MKDTLNIDMTFFVRNSSTLNFSSLSTWYFSIISSRLLMGSSSDTSKFWGFITERLFNSLTIKGISKRKKKYTMVQNSKRVVSALRLFGIFILPICILPRMSTTGRPINANTADIRI